MAKAYLSSMVAITLKQVNENILALKQEVDTIKELLEESQLPLQDNVKREIAASRKLPIAAFKTQAEMEKKFL